MSTVKPNAENKTMSISFANTVAAIVVVVIATVSVKWGTQWIRKSFPATHSNQLLPPPPISLFEFLISLIPLAILIGGVLALVPAVLFMGRGTFRVSMTLLYLGALMSLVLPVPLLIVRLRGQRFFNEFLQLSEVRSGTQMRGPLFFTAIVSVIFLTAGAVVYIFETF
jgi:hypothetical protein